ncbi:aminotransferase class I/II-fold pyridoxal phosphate-dependent enzyme [Alkalicoccus daliensis]|uniref:dTDP-4-amino-4,6-dideoxygalactose transaminase n=1 Tax=Alkalicoccus daliensis TaxID=745820 RepID=A0A1G9ZLA4_9BACI|nr:aminotransferase class I/II-fold pyridoxal phosphate-dependent enzyme [Alkalicoccus daliensis]SDN21865.1 dTDP-4-amino-4,6-dideoxygalactose transaminase [Alkalicoccus daliensis]
MKSTLRKPIYLSPPHMSGEEQNYIEEAFRTNWIAPVGPHLQAFEQEMELLTGAAYAVAVTSGTAAIHLALAVLGIKQGDRVFCSTFTFVASANPILYQGAEPVFIDSEPTSWNMSPTALKRALSTAYKKKKLPKAVIVVHLYGQTSRMEEIMKICNKYKVPVIEDAAESLGSSYKGKASGTIGDIGIYSFNGNKIITTSGGGMLVTNKKDLADKAKFLATQAKEEAEHYQHKEKGYNYRMSNVLAGIGRAQLRVLNERVEEKRKIYQRYAQSLPFYFMPEYSNSRSSRWLTACLLPSDSDPVEIIESMRSHQIEVRRVWKPLHMQPLFQNTEFYQHTKGLSVAETFFRHGICLPSGTNMTKEEQLYVMNLLRENTRTTISQEAVIF